MRLKKEQISEVLSLKDDQVTKDHLIRWFGRTAEQKEPKYNPNDSFILNKGMVSWYKEDSSVTTTIGRVIFNIFLNYSIFGNKFSYFNNQDPKKFHKQISYAFIEGNITKEQHSLYQTKKAWLEYSLIEILVPGMSVNMMRTQPEVAKRKKELLKKYEKELSGTGPEAINAAAAIEKELLDLAKKLTRDDPASRLFDLKKPSFGNNYKNMSVIIGARKDNTNPTEFHISDSDFVDGITKDEFSYHADQLIAGTYSRSVDTQKGGAAVKEMRAAYESEQVDKSPDSDCGTQLYDVVSITDDNVEQYYFHWVKSTKGLIQILPSTAKQFVGKTWKKRSSLYCNNDNYCGKCSGGLYQKLGIEDAGLTIAQIGSTIQSLSMKGFHDSTIKVHTFDFEKYFSD
jgi:hypothetical protein